ncbi:unnamed protein product [Pylaiella littoralis]
MLKRCWFFGERPIQRRWQDVCFKPPQLFTEISSRRRRYSGRVAEIDYRVIKDGEEILDWHGNGGYLLQDNHVMNPRAKVPDSRPC